VADSTASLAKETDSAEEDDEKVDDEADDEEDVDILKEDLSALLKEHDTNKDGKLSITEITDDRADDNEEVKKAFKEGDVNVDNLIDSVELPKFLASLQGEQKATSFFAG